MGPVEFLPEQAWSITVSEDPLARTEEEGSGVRSLDRWRAWAIRKQKPGRFYSGGLSEAEIPP